MKVFSRISQQLIIKSTELGFKHWYECKHKFAGCQTTMYALVENGSTGQQKKKTGQWYSK